MTNPLVLWLNVPDRRLSVNARTHYLTRSTLTKRAREEACYMARHVLGDARPMWEKATVKLTYHFPDKRRRDRDNLLSLCKPIFDALADAGVVKNDADFTYQPVEIVVEPGCAPTIKVEVWETP